MSITDNMEMASALFNRPCISVKKTFFNLKETVFYAPSHSKIEGGYLELDSDNGEKLKELLELPDSSIREMAMKMEPIPSVENGMYDLSFCYSQDRKFAALQLRKYMHFEYRTVTAIRFVEDETAESLLKILLK